LKIKNRGKTGNIFVFSFVYKLEIPEKTEKESAERKTRKTEYPTEFENKAEI